MAEVLPKLVLNRPRPLRSDELVEELDRIREHVEGGNLDAALALLADVRSRELAGQHRVLRGSGPTTPADRRRDTVFPRHAFVGRPDRDCETCGRPDRAAVHRVPA